MLTDNARALDVDLSNLEAIVLSHGHEDHTGGLGKALDAAGKLDVYVHPAAFGTTYWKEGAGVVLHTMPLSRAQLMTRARRLVDTKGPTLVADGIMVTGGIPRVTDFEDTGTTTEEEAFRQYGVRKIMLSHCTGLAAFAEFFRAFPDRCSWPATGSRVEFGR